MIKNKELLEIIERKKNEVSCEIVSIAILVRITEESGIAKR